MGFWDKLLSNEVLVSAVVGWTVAQVLKTLKTLLNNLISGFALNREQAASYLEAVGLSVQARAEELSLEDFAKLSRQLQSL